jgi:hypothetical protein
VSQAPGVDGGDSVLTVRQMSVYRQPLSHLVQPQALHCDFRRAHQRSLTFVHGNSQRPLKLNQDGVQDQSVQLVSRLMLLLKDIANATRYVSLVAASCMVLYGYDASVFNALQNSKHWNAYFNHPGPNVIGMLRPFLPLT